MIPSKPQAQAQLSQIHGAALPLADPESLDPLLERIGDVRYVLLGEASHGTAEYYRWREVLTRRLIEEKDFSLPWRATGPTARHCTAP